MTQLFFKYAMIHISIGPLHIGHIVFVSIQLRRHYTWKMCLHLRLTICLFPNLNSSRQIEHLWNPPPFDKISVSQEVEKYPWFISKVLSFFTFVFLFLRFSLEKFSLWPKILFIKIMKNEKIITKITN